MKTKITAALLAPVALTACNPFRTLGSTTSPSRRSRRPA